jgi:hypothetical protein
MLQLADYDKPKTSIDRRHNWPKKYYYIQKGIKTIFKLSETQITLNSIYFWAFFRSVRTCFFYKKSAKFQLLWGKWWDLERPNLKWPKEKKARKEVFQHLAEYTNGRISMSRMLKWPNPDQVDFHSHALISVLLIWIRPISPCNRLAKQGLQGAENFYSF